MGYDVDEDAHFPNNPYICYCGKKFRREKTLLGHKKIHERDTEADVIPSDITNFDLKCRKCDKKCTTKKELKEHISEQAKIDKLLKVKKRNPIKEEIQGDHY